jgi:hypothetical protein
MFEKVFKACVHIVHHNNKQTHRPGKSLIGDMMFFCFMGMCASFEYSINLGIRDGV